MLRLMNIRILDQDASVFKTIGLDKSKLVSNTSELKSNAELGLLSE